MLLPQQQGIDWPADRNWLGKGQMTGIYSGQCAQVRQDFGMNRLESSGSDYSMGMSFMGKGVNPSYAHRNAPLFIVIGSLKIICFSPFASLHYKPFIRLFAIVY